ncbi:TVP38/TMEM64 family protein [Streptomyces sp. ISL-94]|uniref:TVP38/TMEM64 family protein n=1 Tax=Streptomyces sp. ISL-94 TaxID=2819190 RepID=UPI001BE5D42B|nr:VTT domain-containing protein [Streptomyces sp. ISL-94]MBT2482008.1 TVP38/TMEM64 family protein [Streptomyces sp. ISL-94]
MSLLLAPWTRLSLLVVLLVAAGVCVLLYEPQRILSEGWPPGLPVGAAVLFFAAAYGVCAAAFVPRPLLNLAAGAVFGTQFGLVAAVGGTVLGAGIAFGLGRLMGQEALRPCLRGRWLQAADGQLSRHGFRSMLAVRLFPGVPFVVANYCAAVSRCGWVPFLSATALGVVPNTAAYVIAGANASSPGSPAFLVSFGFIVVSVAVAGAVAWRGRHRLAPPPIHQAASEQASEHPPVVMGTSHGP